ncbi:peritrophin-1-like [Eupeodes corollae]|uniref:peritrophin-1-like n=1 Tax=Eupeodes corollae TaxID=290404 RepID=UPI002490A980|nr:peritrophin-1-like [Eupeodes corollae]
MVVTKIEVFVLMISFLIVMIAPIQARSRLAGPPPHPCEGKQNNETVYGGRSCSIFYICNGSGQGLFRRCPNGFYYDLDKGQCRFDEGNKYQCKTNRYPWGNINPCQVYESEKYFPVPYDCSQFIECDNRRPAILTCPEGLVYNIKLRVCDWPRNVDCRGRN